MLERFGYKNLVAAVYISALLASALMFAVAGLVVLRLRDRDAAATMAP